MNTQIVSQQDVVDTAAQPGEPSTDGVSPGTLPMAQEHPTSSAIKRRNEIAVVGVVLEQHNHDRNVVGVTRTTVFRTRVTCLLVQVTEEDGAIYAMTLNVPLSPEHTARAALLEKLQLGARIRARGRLHTEQRFDRRFATADDPDGRPSRQVVVAVDDIANASEDELDGTWLQLTGRISVVATIRNHEIAIDEEIGRTHLVVEWVEPSQRPGSRAHATRVDRIPLDIPLLLESSPNGLRAGNLVTVEGRLEPFRRQLRPAQNRFVQQYLEDFEQKRRGTYALLSDQARAERERRDANKLRSLRYEQDVRVRAGYVDLHEGQPMSVGEARTAHRAYIRQQKARKQAQGAQPDEKQGAGVEQPPAPAMEASISASSGSDERADRPVRHRRLYPRDEEQDTVEPSADGTPAHK